MKNETGRIIGMRNLALDSLSKSDGDSWTRRDDIDRYALAEVTPRRLIALLDVVAAAREWDEARKERESASPPFGSTPTTDPAMARMTARARVANAHIRETLHGLDLAMKK